jgi:hypothetical protein
LKKRMAQHIKAYKLDVSQTHRDGSFKCPNCGVKITPDDTSEATYAIYDTSLKDNNLDEVVIYCKRCLSFIHLRGFREIEKKNQSVNTGETARKDNLLFFDHLYKRRD